MDEIKLENAQIQKIYKSEEDKNGERYISAKGNPFKKVDIYIDPRAVDDPDFEGKMTYFDYFDNTSNWEIGTTLTGVVTKTEKYGRTFFNFQMTRPDKQSLALDVKKLQDRVAKLEKVIFKGNSPEVQEAMEFTKESMKEEEVDLENDLPF